MREETKEKKNLFFPPGSQAKLLTQDATCFGGGSCEGNNTSTLRPVQNPCEEGEDVRKRSDVSCIVTWHLAAGNGTAQQPWEPAV